MYTRILEFIHSTLFFMGKCPRGRLLVSCVPMRDNKNDEKGYFFDVGSAQRCHRLGPVGKVLFL